MRVQNSGRVTLNSLVEKHRAVEPQSGPGSDGPDSLSRATGHATGLCQTPEPGLWGVATPPRTAAGREMCSLSLHLPQVYEELTDLR